MSKKINKSGKFVLRINPELHAELIKKASEREYSLNQYCKEVLGGKRDEGASLWLQELIRLLKKTGFQCEGVILYGSASRGEEREGSDYDLLVVLETGFEITSDLYREFDKKDSSFLPKNSSVQFALLPEDPESVGSLWLEVSLDGIILFDKSG